VLGTFRAIATIQARWARRPPTRTSCR
jgi:hypothetical protein